MFLSNKPRVPPGINLLQKHSQKLSRRSGNLANPVIFSRKPGEDKDSTGSVTEGCYFGPQVLSFSACTMLIQYFDSTNSIRSFHFVVSGFSTCQNIQPSNSWAIRSQKIFIRSIVVHVIRPWMAYTFTNRFAYPFKRHIRCACQLIRS